METWLIRIYERQRGRTLRDWGLPEIVVDALETIETIYIELVATGRIKPLSPYYPVGTWHPREFVDSMPPYWELRPPLDLEVAAETGEERRQLKADEALEARDRYRAKRLYERARAAHKLISPILHAEDQLHRELADYATLGFDIIDPPCLRALRRFRYALANYTVHPNPAVDAYLFQFDQKLDRIRDAARREILRRLFEGKFTAGEKRECIEVLEADAASGAWADPEADLAWAEAQAA